MAGLQTIERFSSKLLRDSHTIKLHFWLPKLAKMVIKVQMCHVTLQKLTCHAEWDIGMKPDMGPHMSAPVSSFLPPPVTAMSRLP